MNARPVPGTGLVTSRLAYGCMRVAGTMDRDPFGPELEARGHGLP